MVWQAEDGMRFRLAGGYVKVPGRGNGVIGTGPVGSATWTLDALTLAYGRQAKTQFTLTGLEVRNLRSALHRWDVSYIVVTDTGAAPVEAAALFTAVTGVVPVVSHRAWVWTMHHGPGGHLLGVVGRRHLPVLPGFRHPAAAHSGRPASAPDGQPLHRRQSGRLVMRTSDRDRRVIETEASPTDELLIDEIGAVPTPRRAGPRRPAAGPPSSVPSAARCAAGASILALTVIVLAGAGVRVAYILIVTRHENSKLYDSLWYGFTGLGLSIGQFFRTALRHNAERRPSPAHLPLAGPVRSGSSASTPGPPRSG